MNIFNYNLKNKLTVVIPCTVSEINTLNILDSISKQYYTQGINVIVLVKSNDFDKKYNILNSMLKYSKMNIILISTDKSVKAKREYLNYSKTPYVYIANDCKNKSKWHLFNLIQSKQKSEKLN